MEVLILNDNLLLLGELRNELTAAYINTGTVTAQLKEADGTTNIGTPIALNALGVGVDITLGGRTYTDGNWTATIEEDHTLVEGSSYELHLDADAGSDLKAHWEIPITAAKRRS